MANQSGITACPYCETELDKIPSRKKECTSCKNFMYVRTSPQTGEKIVLTQEDAQKVDEEWGLKRRIECWIETLKDQFGVSDNNYKKHKTNLTLKFGKEASDSDTIWAIFNELISKKLNDFFALRMLYYHMALFLNDERKDFFPILQLVAKMQLMDYKKSRTKKVSIIDAGASCSSCKSQAGLPILIDIALSEMPIPCKDCTRAMNDGIRGFCRCTYGFAV